MKKLTAVALSLYTSIALAQTSTFHNIVVNGTATFAGATSFTAPPTSVTPALTDNSTNVATTAFVRGAAIGCPNIVAYGGVGDGTTDNVSAAAAALAANPSGRACIYFPPGKFYFSTSLAFSILTSPGSVTLLGAGIDVTELTFGATSYPGVLIYYKDKYSSAHIRDMTITARGTAANYGINLIQTATSVNSGQGQYGLTDITNVTLRGSDGYGLTNYWGVGVKIDGVSNINFYNVNTIGPNNVAGFGIALDYAPNNHSIIPVVYNLFGCNFLQMTAGFLYAGNAQGVSIVSSNFTANTYGIQAPSTGTNALDQLTVSNSQFNNSGFSIDTESPVQAVTLVGNLFFVQNNTAAVVLNQSTQFSITGNNFVPASIPATGQIGVQIGTYNQGAGVITGNSFDAVSFGVNLTSGSQHVNVQANAYAPAIGTKVTNSGTNNSVGAATP